MGGAVQMLGLFSRFQWIELLGFGWDGVTVAIFAKNNPRNLPVSYTHLTLPTNSLV